MFKLEMFPAGYGDALWIEFGTSQHPKRILIDGGLAPTYDFLRKRILSLQAGKRRFEVFVITHIDNDHIEGALKLLLDESLGVEFGDIWFNGWQHLPEPEPGDELGAPEAEAVSGIIIERGLPWNVAFDGNAVEIESSVKLPEHEIDGGLKLTLLSPRVEQLRKLRPKWQEAVREAGLEAGMTEQALTEFRKKRKYQIDDELGETYFDIKKLANTTFKPDNSEANGSSIALLAEFGSQKCLLLGDAHAQVVAETIAQLIAVREKPFLAVDFFKMSHHGSRANNSKDLFIIVPAKNYLVSTNGKKFGHPDVEAIARAIIHGGKECTLNFNYLSEDNSCWDDQARMEEFNYAVKYPQIGHEGLLIEV